MTDTITDPVAVLREALHALRMLPSNATARALTDAWSVADAALEAVERELEVVACIALNTVLRPLTPGADQ